MRRLRTAGLLGVAAILYVASFPPFFATAWTALLFPIPFFLALEAHDYRRGFRLGYGLGLLSIGGLLHWFAANTGSSTGQALGMWITTAIYLAFAWGAFGATVAFACSTFGRRALWSAPLLWAGMEFVQSQGSMGFAWHSLATPWAQHPAMIQYVSATGMFGVSFWSMLCSVVIFMGARAFLDSNGATRRRALALFAGVLVVLIAAPLIHGLIRTNSSPPGEGRRISFALLQPNIDSNDKWRRRNEAYLELMKLTMALPEGDLDLIVWPETAVPFVLRENPDRVEAIRRVLREKGAVLLTGISDRKKTEPENDLAEGATRAQRIKGMGWRKINSVHLVDASTTKLETYEKLHLVPFGEYVPGFLWFLEDMMMNVGAGIFIPGEDVRLFDLPAGDRRADPVRTAALICLESNYPSLVNRFVDAGAELLVLVANDGWFDRTWEPYQHQEIAVLRAIEHGAPVLRCANTGISSAIDHRGVTLMSSGVATQEVLSGEVILYRERTFFSAAGHWFPATALAVGGIVLLGAAAFRIRRRLCAANREGTT